MRVQAGKSRFIAFAALVFVALVTSLFSFDVQVVDAQRKTQRPTTQKQAQPKPTAKPRSALEQMGAPPPIPTLKKQPEQEVSPGDVVSVDTTEVMFPVTVRDSNGRLVNELTRNDFRV